MKPFLLLATRDNDVAAEEEYAAFCKVTGLDDSRLHRVRMEAGPLPEIVLDDYAGVFIGGGPFNASDPDDEKSTTQQRVETEFGRLLDEIVERDFPFLGACYGIGTLGRQQGGVIDRTYSEPITTTCVSLTPEGQKDPLLDGMPEEFDAFVGHKEACSSLPPTAVLLAHSPACPVQMFRVKRNLYATQFHPELDVAGIITRVRIYRDAGYFPADQIDDVIAHLSAALVTEPPRILQNFVARYG